MTDEDAKGWDEVAASAMRDREKISVHPDESFATKAAVRTIFEIVCAYLAPCNPISWGRMLELLRERVKGHGILYVELYPLLFNCTGGYPTEECSACKGSGKLAVDGGYEYVRCEDCFGLGEHAVLSCDLDKVAAEVVPEAYAEAIERKGKDTP